MFATGHDEDPAKSAMGTPLERIMKMGSAMLDAVRAFKPPSSDGKKFEIRLGLNPLLPQLHTTVPGLEVHAVRMAMLGTAVTPT